MAETVGSNEGRTMRAAQRDRYGSPDVVTVRDVPVPEPGEGQVLVRMVAASVNRADLDAMKPRPRFMRLFMGLRAPRNPNLGTDAAGVVERAGPGVTRLKAGDRVFGDMFIGGAGSFAEFVCTTERAFQPIPSSLTFEQAATLPHSAILALQGLRLRNGRTIDSGARVLIDGASGNVGPFAVQIAKARGAEVTGVCHTDKMDFVRSLGADHVLDYTRVDYTTTGERYDWIVDTDSHHPIRRARRALRPNGAYVTLGGEGGQIASGIVLGSMLSLRSDRYSGMLLWWKPMHLPDVATITELIAGGFVRPAIDRSYPLEQIVEALAWVEDGKARGKVLVTMDGAHA